MFVVVWLKNKIAFTPTKNISMDIVDAYNKVKTKDFTNLNKIYNGPP